MEISECPYHGVPLLKVRGEVDHSNRVFLAAAVEKALTNDTRGLILDFEHVPYLDSGGIAVLLALLRRMRRNHGWLGVLKPSKNVTKLLETVGFTIDKSFRLFPTDEALQQATAAGTDWIETPDA